LAPDALAALTQYDFPGNVRELENILERALAFANEGTVQLADLALKPIKSVADPNQTGFERPGRAESAAASDNQVGLQNKFEPSSSALAESAANTSDDLPSSLPDYLEQIERGIIVRALQKTNYNKTQAAELLGVSFRQLRYQIQKLKINDPK
jgi:two-component system response regulator PilR (NtrC family)